MSAGQTFEEVERGNKRLYNSLQLHNEKSFQNKVRDSLEFIKTCLEASANPVVLCSFGKDSLVLLHLVMTFKRVPVIYWREPFFQSKFKHAQEVAEKWDLEVYDYPPSAVDYIQIDDYFDVYNFYSAGGSLINLFTGTRDRKPEDKRWLCAVSDLLYRPKCSDYEFKWDCVFHGHKQTDPVYIAKSVNVPELQIMNNGFMAMAIRDWTDEDIWQYITQYNLPYNKERYDFSNESSNNDLYSTCHECLDYRKKKVFCPKLNCQIDSCAKTKEQNEAFRNRLLEIYS